MELENTEEWREVPGFPGYEASSMGRIRSWRPPNGRDAAKAARIMRFTADKDGYSTLGLYREGKQTTQKVHVLVLLAFVGPCPEGMQACHFPDRTKSNCAASNLRWDTVIANHDDRRKHGTIPRGEKHGSHTKPESRSKGALNGNAIMTERFAEMLIRMGEAGFSAKARRLVFKVSKTQDRRIARGESWAHIQRGVSRVAS